MSRYWPNLILLAAIWGASYLFIKVALEDIAPAPMMAARLLIAAAVLVAYLVWRVGATTAFAELRGAWRAVAVLGVINAALPFWLIAWGEQHIDSGVAAIAQATVPIFALLLGLRFLPHERVTGDRLAGVALGIVGVGVLTGLHPEGGWWAVAGTLAIVLSSLSYASGAVYGQRSVSCIRGPVLAAGSMLAGGLVLLPFALFQLPDEVPGWKATASLAALTLAGTAFAQLILFHMLALHGSARLTLVTYLMPGFAVFYGALLLDEAVTVAALAGLALILAGVALGSGGVRARLWRAAVR